MTAVLSVAERLQDVQRKIHEATRRANRDPEVVRLVAVSKGISANRLTEAVRAGVKDVGENRIQEAKTKIPLILTPVEWHLIGHLQTNKVRDAVKYFSLIQSIDRMELAQKLSQEGQKQGREVQGLIQVNVAQKATQGGFSVEEVPDAVTALSNLPSLRLRGLMMIAPFVDDPEEVRPIFRTMKNLFDRMSSLNSELLTLNSWNCLSMGMSHDFEVAIEEGANMVRIGTAIFGERSQVNS